MKNKVLHKVWIYIQLVSGCVLCGIGINWIAIPNGFAVTGITGFSMAIEKITGISYTWIYYMIMIIVLILTYLWLGPHDVASIIFLSLVYPAVLMVMNRIPIELVFQEKLISVAIMGVCVGAGTGICYRIGYSYGGTDTIAKLIKLKFLKSVPLKTILMGEDVFILLFLLLIFDKDMVAYALVGQFVFAQSMSYMVFNMGPTLYEIEIVCDVPDPIRSFVIDTLHKSVTEHHVIGGYTGTEKIQLDCVCTSVEYVKLREYIRQHDIKCFMKVSPVLNVFGDNKDFKKIEDDLTD